MRPRNQIPRDDQQRNTRILSAVNYVKGRRRLGVNMALAIHQAASKYGVDKSEISKEMSNRRWHRNLPQELIPTAEVIPDMCPECGYQVGPEDTQCYLCGEKL